jgi:hypothetical protein
MKSRATFRHEVTLASNSEWATRNSLLAGGYKIHVGHTLGEGTESWLFRYVFVLLSVVYGLKNTQKRASIISLFIMCLVVRVVGFNKPLLSYILFVCVNCTGPTTVQHDRQLVTASGFVCGVFCPGGGGGGGVHHRNMLEFSLTVYV